MRTFFVRCFCFSKNPVTTENEQNIIDIHSLMKSICHSFCCPFYFRLLWPVFRWLLAFVYSIIRISNFFDSIRIGRPRFHHSPVVASCMRSIVPVFVDDILLCRGFKCICHFVSDHLMNFNFLFCRRMEIIYS